MAGAARSWLEAEQVLVAAQAGDVTAFAQVYRRFLIDVREFCSRRVRDPGRAEDLAQEVFLRAFQHIHDYQLGRPVWPWLAAIARNLCIDEERRVRRTIEDPVAEPPEPDKPRHERLLDTTLDQVVAEDDRHRRHARVVAALATLRPQERSMVWRHMVEGWSYSEIAHRDGITIDAARNATWRARTLLRATLERTIGDLRIHVLLPLGAALQAMRQRWFGTRVRFRRLLLEDTWLLAEAKALVLVGAALISIASPIDAPEAPRVSPPQGGHVVTADDVSPTKVPENEPASLTSLSGRISTPEPSSPIGFSYGLEKRDEAAAPSSTNYRVEVRDHEGNVVYWEETQLSCGDGRDLPSFLEDSPVRASC